jgi:hypothetical protein
MLLDIKMTRQKNSLSIIYNETTEFTTISSFSLITKLCYIILFLNSLISEKSTIYNRQYYRTIFHNVFAN